MAYLLELQRKYHPAKSYVEQLDKEMAILRVKPTDVIDPLKLPIDEALIQKVDDALEGGGKNVKTLQRALNVFDYADMTRIRKALAAAGVTKETENYQGTNATFIQLIVEDGQK